MIRDRIYAALGFRECRAPIPPDAPGLAPGVMSSNATITLGIADRLRVLISGKLMCDMAHQMSHVPARIQTTSAWAVLPPNYPLPEEIGPPMMVPISQEQFEAEMRRPPDRHIEYRPRKPGEWMY